MATAVLAPAGELPDQGESHSVLGLAELALKDPARLDRITRERTEQKDLIPRFMAIGLAGFTLFAVALTVAMNVVLEQRGLWPRGVPDARWSGRSIASAVLAYNLGLVGATGICLPSFYFYGLLAGIRISMLDVTAHAMKGMAVTAIVLVGLLPIYVAVALGMVVFRAPASWLGGSLYLGLALPFIAGLWGVWSLYTGFVRLADTLPPERCHARNCFLRRLVAAWSACYTAVTPLAVYALWKALAG